jgi:hypothetical protein
MGEHNKSLEMTGMSANVIRKIEGLIHYFPASQFQRYAASFGR